MGGKTGIKNGKHPEEVSVHTLRHSFATHLLEDGMDILSIKNLLGHESIDTTLVYLQIAQLSTHKLFSPLSRSNKLVFGDDPKFTCF